MILSSPPCAPSVAPLLPAPPLAPDLPSPVSEPRLAVEDPALAPAIEALLDRAFGPGRRAKTSYRYRQGVAPLARLCFTAHLDGALIGTLRHWPVRLSGLDDGDRRAGPAPLAPSVVLLGPIAVDPARQTAGIGRRLMTHGLAEAARHGVDLVLLVGDSGYYERFGFGPAADWGIAMPGEAAARVLARPLTARAATLTRGGVILPATDSGAESPVREVGGGGDRCRVRRARLPRAA